MELKVNDFYSLLEEKTLSNPEDRKCYHIYYYCIMSDVDAAYPKLLEILSRIDRQKIPFSLGNKFNDICNLFTIWFIYFIPLYPDLFNIVH